MKNWKTTIAGIATAAFYLGYKLLTHAPIEGNDFIICMGYVGLGSFAKDNNVTGGTKQQ
jgi:hypothetical protein